MSETTIPVQDWTYQTPAPEPVTKPRRRKRGVVMAVAALAVITGLIALIVHLHGSTLSAKMKPNYLTSMSMLEDSVESSLNQENPDATQITDVVCIPQEHRLFVCNLTGDDDTMNTTDVHVNAAGDNWVATPHS